MTAPEAAGFPPRVVAGLIAREDAFQAFIEFVAVPADDARRPRLLAAAEDLGLRYMALVDAALGEAEAAWPDDGGDD